MIKNSAEKFGILTKFFHWLIAMLFFAQFFLIYRRDAFPKAAPEKLQYLLLHKSFGITVFILGTVMICSHFAGTRPIFPINMSRFQIILAKVTHFLLYLAILVMPASGVLMSFLGGYNVFFFGWQLPNPLSENRSLGDLFYDLHVVSAYAVGILVIIHTFAALYHHFIKKDNILKRML